jgi:Zn-dependent protease
MFILEFIILIYSVILHEVAHGWLADYLGDPTARLSGRLTLDPRPHIDPLTTIALPLLLVFTGSPIIFGAAKPVPVDPFNFRDAKKDMALVAAAGPLANLSLALFFSLALRLSDVFVLNHYLLSSIHNLASYGVQINVILAIFNLLPLPPLDGFRVAGGLLPDEYARNWLALERLGFTFLLFVLLFFGPLISSFISPLAETLFRFLLP